MKEGVERIDLEGLGCDQFVSEEEAVAAKEKRRALHEHFKAKKKERNESSQEKPSKPTHDDAILGAGGRPILKLKKKQKDVA